MAKQDKSSLEKFIEELEAKYPVVGEKSDSMRAYDRSSFPSGFLIGADGRIVWGGHPGNLAEDTISDLLAETKILPTWPDAFGNIQKEFLKEDYADALSKVEKEIERGRLEEDLAKVAEQIRDWIVWYGTSSLAGAAHDVEQKRYYEASLQYVFLTDAFKRHEIGEKAEKALEDLLSDDARELEVKAGEKLAKILEQITGEKPKKALLKLRPLLRGKYEETAAGRQAKELAEKLEAEAEKD